jgi:hypothetical protein
MNGLIATQLAVRQSSNRTLAAAVAASVVVVVSAAAFQPAKADLINISAGYPFPMTVSGTLTDVNSGIGSGTSTPLPFKELNVNIFMNHSACQPYWNGDTERQVPHQSARFLFNCGCGFEAVRGHR